MLTYVRPAALRPLYFYVSTGAFSTLMPNDQSTMKRTSTILLLVLSSCVGELTIRTDFDPDYKISTLQRYTWLERTNIEAGKNPKYYNELNDQRIKQAVEEALQSRGYRSSDRKGCRQNVQEVSEA
jgi:hypothetical protein